MNKQGSHCFEIIKNSCDDYGVEYEDIEMAYNGMLVDSERSVFMEKVLNKFIPIVYQDQVYLKDELFDVAVACKEILGAFKHPPSGMADT